MTVSGYINHEGEVVSDIAEHHSGIINHRRTTRQRHLSSGQDENIATAYFAAQYGSQQTQQRTEVSQVFSVITRISCQICNQKYVGKKYFS